MNEQQAFLRELRSSVTGEVRFDAGTRALYATDSSNYRQVPVGVVIPRSVEDLQKALELCRRRGVPLLMRGCGTSLAGQCCNSAVIFDCSKYLNQVRELDPRTSTAWVEPGTILDDLQSAAEAHGLTFGPDPATHDRCTIGGMIGNNSCGVHSVMTGRTSDNVEELDIVTYDGIRMRVGRTSEEELDAIIREGGRRGEIYAGLRALRDKYAGLIRERFPRIPRRVSGYNLDELLPENGFHVARALVGTEGTCVTVLGARVRLLPSPPARKLLVLGYPTVFDAADSVPTLLGFKPVGLEGMDDYLRNFLRAKRGLRPEEAELLPPGTGWLLLEFGADGMQEAEAQARAVMKSFGVGPRAPSSKLCSPREAELVWEVRKSGLGATAFLPNGKNTWPGWEDAAVPPQRLGDYLRQFAKLRQEFGYECPMYGHFGDGCVHMRLDFDMFSNDGVAAFMTFLHEAADLVASFGGSLSGEHGDGQARAALLSRMYGEEMVEAFREFKSIWDPMGKMNPGKVVDPNPPDSNLRLGGSYRPWQPATQFSYSESRNQFSHALLRCVGVGKCRRMEGGTMCPSFMVTREEKHSTRGRARLLQEMVRREVITQGWKSEEVKDALDLCLSCKGCKGDCPVNVDMATYKAEFMSHYYEGRMRPRSAYAMGLIHRWARLASVAPDLANLFTQTPALARVVKAAGGIASQRQIPAFARRTFRKWFLQRRAPLSQDKPRVVLWADTFNNYFLPETAEAAVEVLEAAGFQVLVPSRALCCGRPLYDRGMLRLARRLLLRVLKEMRVEILSSTPMVVLEPSCAAVFRDEMKQLLPDNPVAAKLAEQTFLLSEFLETHAPRWRPPRMDRKALVHGHCHHKALLGLVSDEAILHRMGMEYEIPDTGCCGMAGSFGFEKDHYEIAMQVGERVLLPAVREATPETLIVADGFSCREQIRQGTGRTAIHTAQLLRMALREQ